jgi:hypothetical protein
MFDGVKSPGLQVKEAEMLVAELRLQQDQQKQEDDIIEQELL